MDRGRPNSKSRKEVLMEASSDNQGHVCPHTMGASLTWSGALSSDGQEMRTENVH